jgi:alpha-L-fucosidase
MSGCFVTYTAKDDVIQRAAKITPSPRQIEYQKMEFALFVHFGVNTFNDVEWGSGKESPTIFNPTQLDTDQWAKTAKDAGMKMLLFTCKHHDGFCLWPSKYTNHSVSSSPWQNGKGDVVRLVADSCRKYGLKLGIYLSPADLYQIESSDGYYDNGSVPKRCTIPTLPSGVVKPDISFEYELDDYNRYFMNQLYELLTQYGPIHEVWFDGANPKPNTKQTYNYNDWYAMIRALHPDAVIAIKGPDVRWIGNEAGHARQSEWSVIPIPTTPEEYDWKDMRGPDLGSREMIKNAKHLIWYPAEMDMSIRPGWFYHKKQDDSVKSLKHLLDVYYDCVGGNAVFLLNIPPDERGLFHENDVTRMIELGNVLRATFKSNLALGATTTASHEASSTYSSSNTLDDNEETWWSPGENHSTASIQYDLRGAKTFNRAMLQEHIKSGQRIESFVLEAHINGNWKEVARATTVGYKKLLRFKNTTTNKVRVRVTQSRVCPTLSAFGLYYAHESPNTQSQ